MLVATPEECELMKCLNYECEKQYIRGRCINVCHAVNCDERIRYQEIRDYIDSKKKIESEE